jgi:acetolactate synthase small subunit
LNHWRETYPLGYDLPSDGSLSPQLVIQRLGAIAGPEAVYAAGVGQHQMWAAQFIGYQNPRTWLNSGGLGTMGYAVPAAMGAKVGLPDTTVWAVDGDGCFQMTNQELATCAINDIPIKVALINNSSLGMVRQWQTLVLRRALFSQTDLATPQSPHPRLRQIGRGLLGCVRTCSCEQRGGRRPDVIETRRWAINDRPGGDRLHRRRKDAHGVADGGRRHRATTRSWSLVRWRHRGIGRTDQMSRHTLSVLVEDKPGVLARVASLFSRRGFNIESLAVGPTEMPEVSRMTIEVSVESLPLEQVTKQLNKLVNVLKIVELEPDSSVQREIMLVKVRADSATRSSILETVQLFRAKVVDVALDAVTIEATGDHDKLMALLRVLEPYGIKELVKSGMVALSRGGRAMTDRTLRPVDRTG